MIRTQSFVSCSSFYIHLRALSDLLFLIVPHHPPQVGARQLQVRRRLKVRFLFLAPNDEVKILKKS